MAETKTSMDIWEEFDKQVDTAALAEDVKEAAENGGRREVPHGVYEVGINKLKLVKSKKGDPMLTCWMRVLEGDFKNSLIFMNQVITQGFQIHIANEFLCSLVSECGDKVPDVEFKTYKQYNGLLLDIWEAIDDNFEYRLNYRENDKGYNTFEIEEVYTLKD